MFEFEYVNHRYRQVANEPPRVVAWPIITFAESMVALRDLPRALALAGIENQLTKGHAGVVLVIRKMPRWKRVAEVAPALRIEPIFRLGNAGIQRGSDVRFVHV